MKNLFKKAVATIANYFGYVVVKNTTIRDYHRSMDYSYPVRKMTESKSQIAQDIFVMVETGFKRGGFFVEFGATDGIGFSNTYMLEKTLAWNGILAEPAKVWHHNLRNNRKAAIDSRCVWSRSGERVTFNETRDPQLSTLTQFMDSDMHGYRRSSGTTYEVETVSLVDLLKTHNAPNVIDYLSLDTEGSEYEILSAFDFEAYTIKIITCEHNFTENRDRIERLLLSKGYVQKHSSISQFDSWFVLGEDA